MKLLTKEIEEKLPKLYSQEKEENKMNQEQLREYWRNKKKEYRKNPEVRIKDAKLNKKYYQRDDIKKETIIRMKEYRKTNKYKQYLINYRSQRNKTARRRRENPLVRLYCNMSRCIYESLKAKGIVKRRRNWVTIVGYNLSKLKKHLESKFKKGMNWENYGKLWHIDHIIPRSKFHITSMNCKEIKECWELSNLQPLWKEENLKKGNRI